MKRLKKSLLLPVLLFLALSAKPASALTLEIGVFGGYNLLILPTALTSLVNNTVSSVGGVNFWGRVGLQLSSNVSVNVISGLLPISEFTTTLAYKNSYVVRPYTIPIHADLCLQAVGFFTHMGAGVNLFSESFDKINPEPGYVWSGLGAHLGVGYRFRLSDFISLPIGAMGQVFMPGYGVLGFSVHFFGGVNFSI